MEGNADCLITNPSAKASALKHSITRLFAFLHDWLGFRKNDQANGKTFLPRPSPTRFGISSGAMSSLSVAIQQHNPRLHATHDKVCWTVTKQLVTPVAGMIAPTK